MSKTIYKLKVQPWNKMRYLTGGDYYKTKDGWEIVTADLGNPDYNFLVLIHEFIELYLTQKRGITEPKIKKFDEWFEREKARGKFKNILSPGRHPKAPYRREHMFAFKIEEFLEKELKANRKKRWRKEDEILEKINKMLAAKSQKNKIKNPA